MMDSKDVLCLIPLIGFGFTEGETFAVSEEKKEYVKCWYGGDFDVGEERCRWSFADLCGSVCDVLALGSV